MLGMAGSSNVQGEDQKKLDVLANDVFVTLLRKSGQCAVLVCDKRPRPKQYVHVNRTLRANNDAVPDHGFEAPTLT